MGKVLTAAIVLASASAANSALAVWGVRFEVNSGSGWTTSTTIDVAGGARQVDFRISVYHDGVMRVTGTYGSGIAWAPFRLCMSQRITNFGNSNLGDSLVSFTRSVASGNDKALGHSIDGSDTILGLPNSVLSFSSDTNEGILNPRPQKLETQYYSGTLLIGNNGDGATSRTITLKANTFGFPGAQSGTGGPFGATFLYTPGGTAYTGTAPVASTTIPAVITVQRPCPGDLDGTRVVDDADFQLFSLAHSLLDCADPSMPAGCSADLNSDGIVDDADFTLFAVAYDAFSCP